MVSADAGALETYFIEISFFTSPQYTVSIQHTHTHTYSTNKPCKIDLLWLHLGTIDQYK